MAEQIQAPTESIDQRALIVRTLVRSRVANLMLLCASHHRLFHEGAYRIEAHGGGRFTFFRPDGRAVAAPALRVGRPPDPPPGQRPRAEDGGAPFDLDLTLDALVS